MRIRLIALDIDGTLLDSHWQVPEVNRDAIREATGRGIEVALVTGRRFDFAQPVIDQIDSPLTLIVSGGALVKARDGRTSCRHLLPQRVAREVLEATRAFAARRPSSSTGPAPRRSCTRGWTPTTRTAAPTSSATATTSRRSSPLEDALTEDPIQVMFSGALPPDALARRDAARPAGRLADVGGHHRVRVAGLLARGRELRRLHERGDARGMGRQARGIDAGRDHGGRRQLQRPRDAAGGWRSGGDGQRGGGVETAGLARHAHQRRGRAWRPPSGRFALPVVDRL